MNLGMEKKEYEKIPEKYLKAIVTDSDLKNTHANVVKINVEIIFKRSVNVGKILPSLAIPIFVLFEPVKSKGKK
jgi:hypothetical protein